MSDKQKKQKASGLGFDPLDNGLFTPTEQSKDNDSIHYPPTIYRKNRQRFLEGIEGPKESIGLHLAVEVNDWLDNIVRSIKRRHGKKIQKQVLIQAGVELLRAMPLNLENIPNVDELRFELEKIVERLKAF